MIDRISTYIADLLYDNEIVIIPNLGGFMTSYKASSIDHVQGLIYPPSKNIIFNNNLVLNDGLLLNYIRAKENTSQIATRKLLDEYVYAIKNALTAREIVVFPEVGRLYLDYEHQMQFLPDSVNYNTEVYGLPTVQYYPILRSRESANTDAKKPLVSTEVKTIPAVPQRKRSWKALLVPAMPYILAGAVVLGGIGIYSTMDTNAFKSGGRYMPINMPHSNLNQSPSKKQPVIVEENRLDEDVVDDMGTYTNPIDRETTLDSKNKTTDFNTNATVDVANDLKKEEYGVKTQTTENRDIDTEGETLAPNQNVARIIVHCFGSKANVQKMMTNLMEKGYQPFQEPYRGLTRVGVKVLYTSENKLQKELKKIKNKFNKGAYIHEIDTTKIPQ